MSQPARKRSEYDDVTERELERWPGVELNRDLTGRHYRFVFSFEGRSAFLPYPRSGSDWRGPLNHLSDVRSVLRDLGAVRLDEKRPGKARRERNRTEPRRVNLGERPTKDPTRDPWRVLAQIQFADEHELPQPVAPEPSRPSIWKRIADRFWSRP